jgi:hypothetical protein
MINKKVFIHMDFNRRVLPFFMTYPGAGERNSRDAMRDLEYLQQMYPKEVKRYQQRVVEMLDRMDYDGSMIYDEYPDRFGVERMASSMLDVIKREEMMKYPDKHFSDEKWEGLHELIFVLLNNEIYKRRNGSRRSYWNF